MDNFQTVLRFFMNQKSTIGYSFMALLTIGGERVFSVISFQCPCNQSQNFAYGLTFLLGPAAVLLVFGLFFSSKLWRLYTGCCLNPVKLCPRGNCLSCLRVFMSIFSKACVAPIMWLCVALLNGTFYECAVSGLDDNLVVDLFCKNKTVKCQQELARVPCDRSKLSNDERMELLLMLRAQSQILGWCIIIISATVGLLGTCCTNCRSKVSFLQLTFWKNYMEKEKECFDTFAVEYATKLAERNLQSFFENKDPEPFPFPNHRAWEEISALYTFSRSEQCYSTLQQYVENGVRINPD
ncbi:calcium homeostasis modulator protein 5 isoform X2 [Scomber japonicus]|uniref:calcium homeostasis modulator protein 5 isoform X2 n=1 Tax=Scomber japonicus TaxID=13676 RepID=UPI002305277F|nr:calcium homeostasis modulator protein 5 isoform X2 [Scomber japonicus]